MPNVVSLLHSPIIPFLVVVVKVRSVVYAGTLHNRTTPQSSSEETSLLENKARK
jgi:hypothetical protein